jgi:short-subunit dehydrogenase
MAKRHRGGIYLVSSIAGLGGIANWVAYGAGKGYELLLGEGLWYELSPYGVTAAAYVVGTTETPAFQETQEKHGTGLTGETREEDLKVDTVVPRTPASVAERLFAQLADGPRLYTHPDDKAAAEAMAQMTRNDYVNAISAMTIVYFVGGTNELLEPLE